MQQPPLGTYLREAREAHGLTIRQLARLVEVAPSQVLRWEAGERVPTPPYLVALAEQLELRASELFDLAGRPIPTDRSSLPAMLRADYDLPPEAIAEVEKHIAEVAKKYRKPKRRRTAPTTNKQPERRET